MTCNLWSDFGIGKQGIEDVENAVKNNLNDQMSGAVDDAKEANPSYFNAKDDEISKLFVTDAKISQEFSI